MIPQDQLERLQPMVEQVLAALRSYTVRLSPLSDSALTYQVVPGVAE